MRRGWESQTRTNGGRFFVISTDAFLFSISYVLVRKTQLFHFLSLHTAHTHSTRFESKRHTKKNNIGKSVVGKFSLALSYTQLTRQSSSADVKVSLWLRPAPAATHANVKQREMEKFQGEWLLLLSSLCASSTNPYDVDIKRERGYTINYIKYDVLT